jgi:hypothetical protein
VPFFTLDNTKYKHDYKGFEALTHTSHPATYTSSLHTLLLNEKRLETKYKLAKMQLLLSAHDVGAVTPLQPCQLFPPTLEFKLVATLASPASLQLQLHE